MQALKNQLIETVDAIYFKEIQNKVTEYTNMTLQQMLQHLYDTYGKITKDKTKHDCEEMNHPYNVTLPIETLFAQIKDTIDFADAAHSPYSQAQILNTTFLLLQKQAFSIKSSASGERNQQLIKLGKTLKYFSKKRTTITRRIMQ